MGKAAGTTVEMEAPLHWHRFVLRWMLLSLAMHLVTAWFSRGYHSADEYFQIMEFLNYKLGGTPARDLAVEFSERMRPWMQPFLYWCLVQGEKFAGIQSPFAWAFSFRVFTGLIGWASSYALALQARDWFTNERARRFCVMALGLIWFFPSLHVRPSSESLGGSAFLLGLALTASAARRESRCGLWLIAGAILALSFETRFQMGIAVAGLGAWLLLIARPPLRKLATWLGGFALVFAAGRVIDHWAYGDWSFSPWHYVQYNLVRGEVNRFGQAPWWDVFRMSFTESWPFIGLALALATIIAWIRHPRHILTWSLGLFFLVHEVIAHKELRFFFPIALAGPVLLTLALTSRRGDRFMDPDQGWARWPWRFLLLNNFIALGALCFVPFSRTAQFYEGVYDLIPPGATRFEIFYPDRNPYLVLGNPIYFYRPQSLVLTQLRSYPELQARMLAQPSEPIWIFSQKFDLPPEASTLSPFCQPAYRTIPAWMTHINITNWLERTNAWTLFRCQAR
jgi:phosphatidylinositol glycan class B